MSTNRRGYVLTWVRFYLGGYELTRVRLTWVRFDSGMSSHCYESVQLGSKLDYNYQYGLFLQISVSEHCFYVSFRAECGCEFIYVWNITISNSHNLMYETQMYIFLWYFFLLKGFLKIKHSLQMESRQENATILN